MKESTHQPEAQDVYESPRVELVMTPEELEREVHYAGVIPVTKQTE